MKALLISLSFTLLGSIILAQQDIYSLRSPAGEKIPINEHFISSRETQPFTQDLPVGGLVISGEVRLFSDSSMVRVVLVDREQREYLVYEVNTLFTDELEFQIQEWGEESVWLNNVVPHVLRVEIIDAYFHLREVMFAEPAVFKGAVKGDMMQAQHLARIEQINAQLKSRNIPWVAGETSFSQLSYEEKKAYFQGELPNLYGFEYYTGGIFVMPGALDENTDHLADTPNAGPETSPYVKEFSWTNVHGENWVSPVKNQSGCGSCWAFAAIGAMEQLINLYYNQHLDMDLSEQEIVSCANAGSCNGGHVPLALSYIEQTGIKLESCFPYRASDLSCTERCTNPDESFGLVGGYRNYLPITTDNMKYYILNHPMSLGIIPWCHAIGLVGYKTLYPGDRVYHRSSDANIWLTISSESPLVGHTAWLIKNSWGSWWGDGGYAYVVTNNSDIWPRHTCLLKPPVNSHNYSVADIDCRDNDGDGYYTWGIGPKPAHCPPCPDEADGDDADPCVGPRDTYGQLQPLFTPKPDADNVTVFEGFPVPDLEATGTDIRWYGDYELQDLLHTGSSYSTGMTAVGTYAYHLTQTHSGCESVPHTVFLTILEGIKPPLAKGTEVCFGENRAMNASGENLRWYSDAELSGLVFEGVRFWPKVEEPGIHDYYVTQTVEGIESPPTHVQYIIHLPPSPAVAEDKVFCTGEDLFMYAAGDSITWYTEQYPDSLYDDRNDQSYPIVRIGSQVWMAANLDVGVMIDAVVESSDNGIIEKYYYRQNPDSGAIYGGYYQWEEMMAYSMEVGTQGICPDGWHIPSNEEWMTLEVELGMDPDEALRLGLRGTDQGAKLKAGGSSGFEALMSGKRGPDGNYSGLGYYNTYWNSSGHNRTLSVHHDQVFHSKSEYDTITNGYSVRCVMDDSVFVRNGNSLYVTDYTPGDYSFLVTNTYLTCESEADTVYLSIRPKPEPPGVSDTEICSGEELTILMAEGENINWYHDIEEASFVDQRDDREYDMVQIGNQVWMSENLDAGVQIDSKLDASDNGIIEKYYYDNDPAMGAYLGGLYSYKEIMNYTLLENAQGICPVGWEVPSNRDWMELEVHLGMSQAEATLYGLRGTDQGAVLKEGGSTGFEGLMAGMRSPDGSFGSLSYTGFWNSSEHTRSLSLNHDKIFSSSSRWDPLENGYSLRCIMNDSLFTRKGNQLPLKQLQPGIYSFPVTQTLEGCESDRAVLTLRVHDLPEPPLGMTEEICYEDPIPILDHPGENLRWYSDSSLEHLLCEGESYVPDTLLEGKNIFYVTRLGAYCESEATEESIDRHVLVHSPQVQDTAVCFGEENQGLQVDGEGIQWYGDEDLVELLWTGNVFTGHRVEVGVDSFYVTKREDACDSKAALLVFRIRPIPGSPTAIDTSACEGAEAPVLYAEGEGIRWYADAALELLLTNGNSWSPMISEAGNYSYYVTQTIDGCEGSDDSVSLTLHPLPEIALGNDTTLLDTEILVLGPFEAGITYLWKDGSTEPYLVFNAGDAGPGDHTIYLEASNDWCLSSDTILIKVKSTVSLADRDVKEFRVYPNPVSHRLHLEAAGMAGRKQVVLTDMAGKVLLITKFDGDSHQLKLRDYPPGSYMLKLISEEKTATFRLIKN